MKFRSYVEPPEPMRGLEVPPRCRGGARWRQAAGGDHHDQRAFMEEQGGHHAWPLPARPQQRQPKAAGVVTGDEVEVEVEIDAEPRVVVEPADFARALDADPVARTAYDRLPTAASGSTCSPSRARRRPRRAVHGTGSRKRLAALRYRGQETARRRRPPLVH